MIGHRLLALTFALVALAPAAFARDITGQLAYRERIALADGAQMLVELHGAGGVVAEARIETSGAQVPLAFTIVAPDASAYSVQGAIFVGGRAEWLSDPVVVPAGDGAVDLGAIPLVRQVAMGFSSTLNCGGTLVEVGYVDQTARLKIGADVYDLPQVTSGSGARFSDNATPMTAFWTKGNSAMITVKGVALPECQSAIAPALLPLTARGNEPGWRLDLSQTGYVFDGMTGEIRMEGPLPESQPMIDGARFDVSDGFGFGIARSLCRDTMTGMPHPVSVTVTDKGQVLQGCGGNPADLLAGAWTVEHVDGAVLPEGAEVSMDFDATDQRVFGAGGCNRYNGGFTLTGEGLSFGPAASTMMACPQDLMAVEATFLKGLATVDRFDLTADGKLELFAGGTTVVRAHR